MYSGIVSCYRNFCLLEKQPLPGWVSTSTVLFVKTCLPWEKTVQVAVAADARDGVKVGSDDLPSAGILTLYTPPSFGTYFLLINFGRNQKLLQLFRSRLLWVF